ncbi:Uncharacterised protein [Mycobacteroides abscessus subsp. abscessus]|nr:Uncharacterised protein [Mycobacteroides abscessus subsp. abscessus]
MAPTASHTTPLSTATPDPSSQSIAGRLPIPRTTRSVSRRVPSDKVTDWTRSCPSTASTPTPTRTSTPSLRCSRATRSPSCWPIAANSGAGCGSTRTTSTPLARRVAATSQPMKPAPTTTARRAFSASPRSAKLSSAVRST